MLVPACEFPQCGASTNCGEWAEAGLSVFVEHQRVVRKEVVLRWLRQKQNRKSGQPACYNGASTGTSMCPAWQCTTLGSHLRMARVNTAGGISVDLGFARLHPATPPTNVSMILLSPERVLFRKHYLCEGYGPPGHPKCSNLVQAAILGGCKREGFLITAVRSRGQDIYSHEWPLAAHGLCSLSLTYLRQRIRYDSKYSLYYEISLLVNTCQGCGKFITGIIKCDHKFL